jgi:hypothetical protein
MAVTRPSEEYVDRLRRVADIHGEWERANLAGAAFNPRGPESDYNQHHLDVDASAAVEQRFRDQINGVLRSM